MQASPRNGAFKLTVALALSSAGCADGEFSLTTEGRLGQARQATVTNPGFFTFEFIQDSAFIFNTTTRSSPGSAVYNNAITLAAIGDPSPPELDVLINSDETMSVFATSSFDNGVVGYPDGGDVIVGCLGVPNNEYEVTVASIEFDTTFTGGTVDPGTDTISMIVDARAEFIVQTTGTAGIWECDTGSFEIQPSGLVNDPDSVDNCGTTIEDHGFCMEDLSIDVPVVSCSNLSWGGGGSAPTNLVTNCLNSELGLGSGADSEIVLAGSTDDEIEGT